MARPRPRRRLSNLNEGTREKPLVSRVEGRMSNEILPPQRRDQGETPGQHPRSIRPCRLAYLNEGTREKPLVSIGLCSTMESKYRPQRRDQGETPGQHLDLEPSHVLRLTSTKGPGRNPWSGPSCSRGRASSPHLNEGTREKPLVRAPLRSMAFLVCTPQRRDQGETPGQPP